MGDEVRGRASDDDFSPGVAAFWAEVDNVVRLADDLQVVLHHYYRIALIHQRLQDMQEFLDVRQVQPGRGFIEEVERARLRGPTQLIGEFDALGFPAGERVARLTQGQIPEPGIIEDL